jgi:hypothetical protein
VVLTAKDLSGDDRERLKGAVERVVQKGGHSREDLLAEIRRVVSAGARREPGAAPTLAGPGERIERG